MNGQADGHQHAQRERRGRGIDGGEFGSLLRSIFDPGSAAEFNWDHWGTLRGKRMAVFSYAIDSGHSNYTISYGEDQQRIITAYEGLVYADPDTGEVARIKFVAVNIPKDVSRHCDKRATGLRPGRHQRSEICCAAGGEVMDEERRGRHAKRYRVQAPIGSSAPTSISSTKRTRPTTLRRCRLRKRRRLRHTEKPTPAAQKVAGPWDLPTPPPPAAAITWSAAGSALFAVTIGDGDYA